ncbi:hypothetical protein D3C71_2102680 [compost metagenome]
MQDHYSEENDGKVTQQGMAFTHQLPISVLQHTKINHYGDTGHIGFPPVVLVEIQAEEEHLN